jgi:hypothetical protein
MYSTIDNLKEAFKKAWEYKILWIFAVMLAGAGYSGSGNFNTNFSRDLNNQDIQEFKKLFKDSEPGEFIESAKEEVLGLMAVDPTNDLTQDEFTELINELKTKTPSSTFTSFEENIYTTTSSANSTTPPGGGQQEMLPTDMFMPEKDMLPESPMPIQSNPFNKIANVFAGFDKNLSTYVPYIAIVGMALLIAFAVGLATMLILKNWVVGAFLQGTKIAYQNAEKVKINLKELSNVGIKNIKELIKLDIIYFLITVAAIIAILGISIPVIAVTGAAPIFLVFIIPIYILLFAILAIAFTETKGLAQKNIVFAGMETKSAIKPAISQLFDNFGRILGLDGLIIIIGIGFFITTGVAMAVLAITVILLPVVGLILLPATKGYFTTTSGIAKTTLYLEVINPQIEKSSSNETEVTNGL